MQDCSILNALRVETLQFRGKKAVHIPLLNSFSFCNFHFCRYSASSTMHNVIFMIFNHLTNKQKIDFLHMILKSNIIDMFSDVISWTEPLIIYR